MATSGRRKSPTVIQELVDAPYEFDFFQAVRLLEWHARELATKEAGRPPQPVGYDGPADHEDVRFRAHQSHTFPPGEISALKLTEPTDTRRSFAELTVAFLGLTGPSGVLPQHYTSMIIERMRTKDFALRDFLDLFNHRAVSLFYRAWEKHRFPFGYERARTTERLAAVDAFTQALFCLTGFGTSQLRGRLDVDDEAFLHYAGHFAQQHRPAIVLESLLSDYFELPVSVHQFQGQWLYLSEDDFSRFPQLGHPNGINCQLGKDVIIGERVWSVENKFRVRIGALPYADFSRFVPGGGELPRLCQMIRTYVGPEYDFDIQLVLNAHQVPACQLGGDAQQGTRLGWNSWLSSQPMADDVDDAIFRHDGFPETSRN